MRAQTFFSVFSVVLFLFASCKQTKKVNTYSNGVVVTAHYLASDVGKEVLQNGGNAYDAAVAVQFSLAVSYPRAGNIAGGGFAVIRTSDGEFNSLDFRETAPLAAYEEMYQDNNGDVDLNLSQKGHLAVGVPGTVDGMMELHSKYGSMSWEELLEPAIKMAQEGVILSLLEANKLNVYHDAISDQNKTNSQNPYLSKNPFEKGDTIINHQLANVLKRVRDRGRKGFYEGETAGLIVAEMERNNGIITLEDLSKYKSVWRKPTIGKYREHKIISMPPPSSGGIALLQLLKGAEQHKMNEFEFGSLEHVHVMIELERRVYADRATWLGDPDFIDVPTDYLIGEEYLKERFGDIELSAKTNSQEIKAGEVDVIESFETTHFSIVDSEGNAIALTTTLNGNYGSKVVVEGGGFFLNNEMDDFSSKPGIPNQFGLVGGKANAIKASKRMLSSMTPTIVEKEGELYMVLGSPGGSTIITCVFQNIINGIDFQMNAQQVVDAPRIHSQWLPDEVYVENDAISEDVSIELEKLGHILKFQSRIGMMANIQVDEQGKYVGAADTIRHKDCHVSGY